MPIVRNIDKYARAGMPTRGPEGAQTTEYILSPQRVLDLIDTPDLFFADNSTFEPLRATTVKALKRLADAGIIGPKPKRGGCGGCARRKLLSFALQFVSRVQMVVLAAQSDARAKQKLEADLRAYVRRKHDLADQTPITLYARQKNGKVRKVVL